LARVGEQHKYLWEFIGRGAESRGFHATVEKPIPDGLGGVDVPLEKHGCSIACEISVTSSTDREVANIQKCLALRFEHAVLVSSDENFLGKAGKATYNALNDGQIKRVRFLTSEQLFAFIEALEAKVADPDKNVTDSRQVVIVKEVERLLKIDVKTIYSYVGRGLLPYVRIQSNLRFLKSEILKWVEEHRFRPKSPSSRK